MTVGGPNEETAIYQAFREERMRGIEPHIQIGKRSMADVGQLHTLG